MPIDESRPFVPVRIAVLTVSDTRGLAEDRSGDTLVGRLEDAGHILADRAIVRDDIDTIVARLHGWIDDDSIDCVITTGGTRRNRPRCDARSGRAGGDQADPRLR